MDIYVALLKNPNSDVDDIARILQKDTSTIYKALRNLMDKGLVRREYRILKSGGYKYLYHPVEFAEFKRMAIKSLEEWFKSFGEMLEDVERATEKDLILASK